MKISKIKNILFFTCLLLFAACTDDGGSNDGSNSGQGGSMARFSIKDDVLYVVDNRTLKIFDVSTASNPRYMPVKDQNLDAGAETIFTMDTLLFIGSENGLYIYNITRPDFPQRFSFVSHIRSCDPVVASEKYAYVTLNSASTRCNRGTNELLVFDISNPAYPYLQKTIEMSAPKGLGVDGRKLFVCDRGLKIFDISNPANPVWIDDLAKIPEADNIDAYDVIPRNGILLLIGKNGFYQFDYTGEKVKFLSKIEVSHE